MHRSFTHRSASYKRLSSCFSKAFFLLLLILAQAGVLSAHTVDYFSSCGYVCAGSTVTVNAHLSATASNTNYNWQFRDNSGAWKCFVNGINTINGVAFTVSNATARGQLSAAPTLTIANATTALSNVDVRIVMADGTTSVSPCASNPSYPVYGTDKSLKLHVLTGTDCSKISQYCGGAPTTPTCQSCQLSYPDNSNLPRSGVAFSESDVLQTAELVAGSGGAPSTIRVWYNDEHAITLGVRRVIVKTSTGSTTTDYAITPTPSSPTCISNPLVGSTVSSGDQAPNDVAAGGGRPLFPALFITDLTVNGASSRAGDWQQGGTAVLPSRICGTWKGAVRTVDKTKSPALITITPDSDPAKNGWNIGSGEAPSGGFSSMTNEGYGAEVVWDLTKLGLIPGHNYRFQVMVHDGDQNKAGGDAGEKCFTTVMPGTPPPPPPATNLTLGNQVWNDFDGDGKRDDNEPGIPGAPISLYTDNDGDNLPDGPAIKTTISDSLGHYQFTNLAEGRYIASMPILPGYQKSPNTSTQETSPFPDNDIDNDNNLVRLVGPNGPGGIVYTNAITLTVNGEPTYDGDGANGNNTFDLAECGNSFIGDFVWNDYNGNGIQDAGEPGINGVPVTITFSDGRTATTTTLTYNAPNNLNIPQFDGYYNFPNLGPGTYKISFGTPAGLHASPANAGDDAKDSDPVNGAPVTVTLAADQSNFTIDAGFTAFIAPPPPVTTCPNLSVGNMVFNDANGNGVKDATEQGIGGLTVKLYADNDGNNVADGAAISTLMTADDGTYYFGNLAAGKYIVGVTTGSGYVQTTFADATPDDNKDNDNNGVKTVNGEVFSNAITLSAGDEPINDGSDNNSNLTLDFGLKVASIPCTNHCDCHNDCTHTGCGHPNCGHNSCKNDCNHTGCGHPNCGHNSCKNDCKHAGCGHPNCGHNSCKNDCTHTGCGHPNCGHNSCKNDCKHAGCGHPNCGHNSCKNDCTHTGCGHSNCGKKDYRTTDHTTTEVSVYPNPTTSYFQLKVDAAKSGIGQVRITDEAGHIVATKNVTISQGSNSITFSDLGELKSGRYNVQLLFGYHVYNQQLLLIK